MSTSDDLRYLMDRAAIADVIHAYCFHFDHAEIEPLMALFTDDAVVDYGPDMPSMTGVDEIRPAVARGLAELFAATSHHVSNIVVTFDGPDRAGSVCYLYAWHLYRETGRTGELWAQYHHDFRRTEAGWKIARLVLRAAGTENFHRARMHPIGRRAPDDRAP
jgi:ketosteroid isomerase-like protein